MSRSGSTPNRVTKEELAASLAALERESQLAVERLRDAEERASALADEVAATEGRAKLARRAVDEFEARIVEQREALAAVEEYERACNSLGLAVRARDDAARRVAAATTALLSELKELATTRAAAESVRTDLVQRYGRSPTYELPSLPAEPQEFTEAWAALREQLGAEIGASLDEELLEAAAQSPFGRDAVNKLPPHLQEAGRRRWVERNSARGS